MTDALSIYYDTQDAGNHGWAYRWSDGESADADSGAINTLDDLLAALRLGGDVSVYPEGSEHAQGLDSLPTFGGDDVVSTEMVWSWDATRMLVGTCPDDFEIVPR